MTRQHPQRRDGTRNSRDADRDGNGVIHRLGRGVRRLYVRHPFACTLTEALQESRCESSLHRSVAFVKVIKSHGSGPSPKHYGRPPSNQCAEGHSEPHRQLGSFRSAMGSWTHGLTGSWAHGLMGSWASVGSYRPSNTKRRKRSRNRRTGRTNHLHSHNDDRGHQAGAPLLARSRRHSSRSADVRGGAGRRPFLRRSRRGGSLLSGAI
jgi:hypothetical protein